MGKNEKVKHYNLKRNLPDEQTQTATKPNNIH